MGLRGLACLVTVGFSLHAGTAAKSAARSRNPNPQKFLIVSAPRDSKIAYMKIRRFAHKRAKEAEERMADLITTGMVHPQGLAVDHKTNRLFVADPDSKKVFAYDLRASGDTLRVGPQRVLAQGIEARWVAVDPTGDVFFTDEPRNQILRVSHAKGLRGNATPGVVFDGASLTQVNAPGGVAIDSFHTFWVNKQIGMQVGSVVKAPKDPDPVARFSGVQTIAKNTDKSYGICLALNNVFFTQPESTIYGVKKGGSAVVPISDRLTNPRGCAWDGDGTVYVADRGANAVYSFAGNMQALNAAQFTKAVDFQDAFGVAVYSHAAHRFAGPWAAALFCLSAWLLPAGGVGDAGAA
mmetsp:Transcript_89020/g.247329  ORF Transcript_89020/g.247329 Transcript_89020/m.247329 type:complete len:352 (-) Transcript_89020:82-1137(-)